MRQEWAWSIQGGERMSVCGKQREQSGEEKETERKQRPRFLGLWRHFEDFAFPVKKPLKRLE